ncbi:MAG TPA: NAD-dependent epimerase/dehydratase family protein [Pseudomonadota bacterium]|nr:NAD-dependent epimerase/dehydratase family protein [Pseudomonadota bacterium]
MKVFVTGGNGFIGSAVVRLLIAGGHQVRCLLRQSSQTERLAELPYERVEGDIRDAAAVARGLEGCGAVIHLASLSAWDLIDSPLMDEVVEGGTRNVLAAATARPGTRVVFVSSILAINGSAAPYPFDETATWTLDERELIYSRSKRQAEALCQDAVKAGADVVIVNPGEVYGPHDTALITACNLIDFAKSSPVLVCDGGTSVVHVDDVALGVVRAMERGRRGERYILGGENLTIKQLAEHCLSLLGQKKTILKFPNSIIRAVAAAGKKLHLPLPFNPHVIPYATRYWFMDAGKAQRELGVSFRSARDTLAPTLAWLKESGRIA